MWHFVDIGFDSAFGAPTLTQFKSWSPDREKKVESLNRMIKIYWKTLQQKRKFELAQNEKRIKMRKNATGHTHTHTNTRAHAAFRTTHGN